MFFIQLFICIADINGQCVFLTLAAMSQLFLAPAIIRRLIEIQSFDYYSQVKMIGERGSGAGKGGGGGGSIRDAGGAFGKMEAAHEDQYFYNLVSYSHFSALIEFLWCS